MIAKSLKHKKGKSSGDRRGDSPDRSLKNKRLEDRVPKAYRLGKHKDKDLSSDESDMHQTTDEEIDNRSELGDKSEDDSGLDSDGESVAMDKLQHVEVSSLLTDMEKIKKDLIQRNQYDKLKEKKSLSESDDEWSKVRESVMFIYEIKVRSNLWYYSHFLFVLGNQFI